MQFAKNNEYYLKALKNTHVLNKEGYQADIYLLKVNNRNTRTRCEICSKLTIKIPERRQCRRSGIFILNFTYFTPCSSVSIVKFEQVNAGWHFI